MASYCKGKRRKSLYWKQTSYNSVPHELADDDKYVCLMFSFDEVVLKRLIIDTTCNAFSFVIYNYDSQLEEYIRFTQSSLRAFCNLALESLGASNYGTRTHFL